MICGGIWVFEEVFEGLDGEFGLAAGGIGLSEVELVTGDWLAGIFCEENEFFEGESFCLIGVGFVGDLCMEKEGVGIFWQSFKELF